jgi:hypothetical protein
MLIDTFENQDQAFILVWEGNEQRAISWNGEQVLIPRRDEVLDERHRFQSAKDRNGKYFPGTVIVKDDFRRNAEGERVQVVNARTMIEQNQKNRAKLFAYGLMVVTSIDDIPKAREESAKRWEKCQESADMRVLQEETQRIAQHEKTGSAVPPTTPERAEEIRGAMARQNERNRLRNGQSRALSSDLKKLLDGTTIESAPPSIEQIMTPDIPDSGEDLIHESAVLGVVLSEAEIAGLKAGDAKVMNAVVIKNEEAANAKLGEPPVPVVNDGPMLAARAVRKRTKEAAA